LPIFNETLKTTLRDEQSQAKDILAEHIAEIISKSYQNDSKDLSEALKNVLASSISREIEENRDKMIDALYPILGGMVSRYVANTIAEIRENIDKKIDEGLSLKRLERKIKSKLTGVSESELILQEETRAKIRAIFVIQRDTGLLIAESSWQNDEFEDPHIVASMASAIKDFIEDWIKTNQEDTKVQLVSYGNATLYIESAGSVYLIAFLDQEPDIEQRKRIQKFFAKIVDKYFKLFQHFDGDDSNPDIKKLSQELDYFIQKENDFTQEVSDKESIKSKKWIILSILLAILLYFGIEKMVTIYNLYSIERLVKLKTGESITADIVDGRVVITGDLTDLNSYISVHKVLDRELKGDYIDRLNTALISIVDRLDSEAIDNKNNQNSIISLTKSLNINNTTILSIEQKIDKLESISSRNSENIQKIETKLKNMERNTKKIYRLATIDNYIAMKMESEFDDVPYFDKRDLSLNFNTGDLFERGESSPNPETIKRISKYIEKYILLLIEDKKIYPYLKSIIIEGYTDSLGDKEFNLKLSQKRADAIKRYILSLPKFKNTLISPLIKSVGKGSSSVIIENGKENYRASRRIVIRFKLDREKILKNISDIK